MAVGLAEGVSRPAVGLVKRISRVGCKIYVATEVCLDLPVLSRKEFVKDCVKDDFDFEFEFEAVVDAGVAS